jgi:hypothetical protein
MIPVKFWTNNSKYWPRTIGFIVPVIVGVELEIFSFLDSRKNWHLNHFNSFKHLPETTEVLLKPWQQKICSCSTSSQTSSQVYHFECFFQKNLKLESKKLSKKIFPHIFGIYVFRSYCVQILVEFTVFVRIQDLFE